MEYLLRILIFVMSLQLIHLAKTNEKTRMQVGALSGPIKLVVSTVSEAEHISGYLARYKEESRHVNVRF